MHLVLYNELNGYKLYRRVVSYNLSLWDYQFLKADFIIFLLRKKDEKNLSIIVFYHLTISPPGKQLSSKQPNLFFYTDSLKWKIVFSFHFLQLPRIKEIIKISVIKKLKDHIWLKMMENFFLQFWQKIEITIPLLFWTFLATIR